MYAAHCGVPHVRALRAGGATHMEGVVRVFVPQMFDVDVASLGNITLFDKIEGDVHAVSKSGSVSVNKLRYAVAHDARAAQRLELMHTATGVPPLRCLPRRVEWMYHRCWRVMCRWPPGRCVCRNAHARGAGG